jgi:hypothetical protein
MADVVIWDTWGGIAPSFVRTQRVGGSHMHLAQVAEFLAGSGKSVEAYHQGPSSYEGGVRYCRIVPKSELSYDGHDAVFGADYRNAPHDCTTLILVGNSEIPRGCHWDRAYAFQVIDPRPCEHLFDHMRGTPITMVCVSEWQAGLFRAMGFDTIVIPVPMPDEWYEPSRPDMQLADFGCFSSWNKGTKETIEAWDPSWGTLMVGSPYSHPEGVHHREGVTWIGTLAPRERWIWAMRSVRAIARVCTIGETFGVVDVAARAMGLPVYTLVTGDMGALEEVGASPFRDRTAWATAIRERWKPPTDVRDVNDFRASRVLPQWLGIT